MDSVRQNHIEPCLQDSYAVASVRRHRQVQYPDQIELACIRQLICTIIDHLTDDWLHFEAENDHVGMEKYQNLACEFLVVQADA